MKKNYRLNTHRNGGSFDLTIINNQGKELDMGTNHDDLTERAALDYFEKQKKLTVIEKEMKKNRQILKKTMVKADFQNYAPEWWHWSFKK